MRQQAIYRKLSITPFLVNIVLLANSALETMLRFHSSLEVVQTTQEMDDHVKSAVEDLMELVLWQGKVSGK